MTVEINDVGRLPLSPRRGDRRDPLAGIETRARTRPGTLRLALALLLLAPLFTEDVQGQIISIEPASCGIRLTAPSRADAVEYRWRASTYSGRCVQGGGSTSVIRVSGPSFDLGTTTGPSLDSVPTTNLTTFSKSMRSMQAGRFSARPLDRILLQRRAAGDGTVYAITALSRSRQVADR